MKTKMTNRISAFLLAAAMLMLSACSVTAPEPQPTATPEPRATDAWVQAAEARYNMRYDGFAGYWDSMCDGLYGDSVKTILSIVRFDDKDREVAEKRAEYAEKYGDDWHYTVIDRSETQLDDKACSDFAAELEDISTKANVLVSAAEKWDEQAWQDFASAHDCTVDDAKKIVAACKTISEKTHEAKVTKALDLTLTLEFSGSKTKTAQTTEQNTVYEVNGVYVSEMLLDCTYSLLNLVS